MNKRGAGRPTVAGQITAVRVAPRQALRGGRGGSAVRAERKAASSGRNVRPSLIALSDVDNVFDDEFFETLAKTAKLPPSADTARFAESVRVAVRIYLEAKPRLSAPKLRKAIERLHQLNARAERGGDQEARALGRAVDTMPADIRNWLGYFCKPQIYDNIPTPTEIIIPTPAEIISPATRENAVQRLSVVLSHGGIVVIGRRRPGGKRSRSFKPLLNVPIGIKRKRPRGEAERQFVQWLAVTYTEATEKCPPYRVSDNKGPFLNFVCQCFEAVGAPSGNVPRLINEVGKARPRHQSEAALRSVTNICTTTTKKS